jgi:hypothetical protein
MSGAFKYGTLFIAQAHTLRVQKTLTTVLALACGPKVTLRIVGEPPSLPNRLR